MKGFSGDARLGVCIENVYVKGKVDQLIVAFASPNDHKMFVRHVGPQLQKLEQQAVRPPPPVRIASVHDGVLASTAQRTC